PGVLSPEYPIKKKNIKLKIAEKPYEIKAFRTGDYQVVISFSSQARYDHFDTLPRVGDISPQPIYYSREQPDLQTIFSLPQGKNFCSP
ncbi:MAG: hypothetical protein Q4C06_02240, partial [Bacillota bacterium]|nr:hypothetical protein [Bacillota bacterium]